MYDMNNKLRKIELIHRKIELQNEIKVKENEQSYCEVALLDEELQNVNAELANIVIMEIF